MGRATRPHLPRARRPWLLLSASLVLAACGGDKLLLPADGQPAQLSILDGSDNQSDTVGQALTNPLSVKATDPANRPVVGLPIVFVAPPGGAVAPGDTIVTDADGVAQVMYTLSTTAGEQVVQAHTTSSDAPLTVSFHAMASPESAQTLVAVRGDSQSAQTSLVLPESLVVQAVDRFGNGVPGVKITWEAKSGGNVSPDTVTTGADGRAATQRMLGDTPGPYVTDARAELEGSPVAFTATGVAPPSPQLILVTEPSPQARAGVPLGTQPGLQLRDAFGAPMAQEGVNVTVQVASGGGTLGGETAAKSDANGVVTFKDLELRGEVGTRTLIFAAEGFTPVTSSPINLGAGTPDARHTSVSVGDGTAGARTSIAMHLGDEFGNPITDAVSALSITIVGANPTSGLPVSQVGEGDYATSYVPIHAGTDEIQVQYSGGDLEGGSSRSKVDPGPSDAGHTDADISRSGGWMSGVVTVRDAQGNVVGHGGDHVQLIVNGFDITSRTVHDQGDGTYTFGFFAFAPQLTVAIALNGEPIQGSPFTP